MAVGNHASPIMGIEIHEPWPLPLSQSLLLKVPVGSKV